MKILIIEDEALSAAKLRRMVEQVDPNHKIVGECTSVRSAVDWLSHNECDLIFMDVQLSDGLCFEIFRSVEPRAKVVITTAFDQYAIAAFKVGSIDYLLKPIETSELIAALHRAQSTMPIKENIIENQQKELLSAALRSETRYKPRFTIRLGDKILMIETTDIALVVSEDKSTIIITSDRKRHLSEMTLDLIESQLNPELFFRISRGCIVGIKSIKSVSRSIGGRMKVNVEPIFGMGSEPLFVSRMRTPDFLRWIEGEI